MLFLGEADGAMVQVNLGETSCSDGWALAPAREGTWAAFLGFLCPQSHPNPSQQMGGAEGRGLLAPSHQVPF